MVTLREHARLKPTPKEFLGPWFESKRAQSFTEDRLTAYTMLVREGASGQNRLSSS